MECSGRLIRKLLSRYKIESDLAFRKMAKRLGNEMHSYWVILPNSDGGAYTPVKKRTVYFANEIVKEIISDL